MADTTTSGPIGHLKTVHNIDQNGEVLSKKRKGCLDNYTYEGGHDKQSEVDNTLAAAFEQHHFRALLYD